VAFRAKNGVSGEKWGFSIKKGDFVCKIDLIFSTEVRFQRKIANFGVLFQRIYNSD
jgi:hypothetical protein